MSTEETRRRHGAGTGATLVLLFGVYCGADGILATWIAFAGRKDHDSWWALLIAGLIGIGVGIITFATPGVTALALLFYIAIRAIVSGVLEIVAAIRLRKDIEGEWGLILGGILSVLFGAILMARPGPARSPSSDRRPLRRVLRHHHGRPGVQAAQLHQAGDRHVSGR